MDLHGHGTHTIGTITGASANDTAGVAPGSLWIASNAVYAGSASDDFDNTIIAAFEFFADPDGDPTTSEDVPDVIQNSWGITANPTYGYVPCDSRWWDAIDNCEAAGVVSPGRRATRGPARARFVPPATEPRRPTNCFSIGSVGYGFPYVVSEFSSRGASACGGAYAIKPEVVAPGEDIVSTVPGNNFAYMSGTSMAGPHVAGIVSLMRQANPDLDVIDIKQILMDTAIDVGAWGQDNNSGWGLVDAYEAVLAAMSEKAVIQGRVTDSVTGEPLEGVEVKRAGYLTTHLTDEEGYYSMSVRSGPSVVEFSLFSYTPQAHPLDLMPDDVVTLDVVLAQRPIGTVSGVVYGPDGQPVRDAMVKVVGMPLDPVITEIYGNYEFVLPIFDSAAYELVASADGLAYVVEFIGLPESRVLDFHLPDLQLEGFESGTMGAYPWVSGGNAPMFVDVSEVYEGAFSVRSGDIADQETSELSVDFYVAGEGEFSFWFKTECESGHDGLLFYINGIQMGAWTGERDWSQVTRSVGPGLHTFKWVYSKDFAVSVMRDAVWIDRIQFPGDGVEPGARLEIDQANVSMTFHVESADSTTLPLFNSGSYQLDYSVEVVPFAVNEVVTAEDLEGHGHAELINKGLISTGNKSGGVDWVTVTPVEGTVHPGVGTDLKVRFDSTGKPDGSYYALLEIASNDPAQPLYTVPLIMTRASVSGIEDSILPARVELAGAVPNPFNPKTFITYSMPMAGEVTLRIYDVSGRLVRDLVSGPRSAGRHREPWDGRDAQGMNAASGVYFARLNVAGQMEMKSMLLLR